MKLSAYKIFRYLRIWWLQIRCGLMQRMAYPYNFYLMVVGVFVQMVLSIAFIDIIFKFVDNISGWTKEGAMMILASYMILEGLMWATCSFISGIQRNVRMGTMDMIITRPIDTQFLVSVWRADPEDWMRPFTALIIFGININGLGVWGASLFFNICFYFIMLFFGFLILYSITLFIKTVAFWVIEGSALWSLGDTVSKLSQYPTDIFFHKSVKMFFSIIIPVTFMTTIPVKILINGPKFSLMFYSFLLVLIFFIASRKFFHFGLKNYKSASS